MHLYQQLIGDIDWSSCDTRRKVAMFRYWNRLIDIDDSRLPKIGCRFRFHKFLVKKYKVCLRS